MVEQAEQAAAHVRSHIQAQVRTVHDWPKPGVAFRDITPLLGAPDSLRLIVAAFIARYRDRNVAYFAGLEARGFILAPLLAYELGAGFIPVRKQGKLPYRTFSQTYDLEYGQATLEVHVDACPPGARVVLIDDLIATGGTMLAARALFERLGAEVLEGGAIIDLPALEGSARLRAAGLPLFTLCDF